MLIVASITTKCHAAFLKRWKLEAGIPAVPGQRSFPKSMRDQGEQRDSELQWPKDNYVLPDANTLGPSLSRNLDFAGGMVVFDWNDKKIIWESNWHDMLVTPHGFTFADGTIYVADCEAANVFQVSLDEPGTLMQRISHPSFNDTHTVARTSRGLLVTNSGSDSIQEIDHAGNVFWEWWACEHGLDTTPDGLVRKSGRGEEHRNKQYHTRYQTTHVNKAEVTGQADRYVLATLFHQGLFVVIDRSRPTDDQRAEIITAGLARPHGPIKFGSQWIVANSLGKEFLIFNENLSLSKRVPYDGGWIQDITVLSNGHVIINDVGRHEFVELEAFSWREIYRHRYDENWRVAEVKELPRIHEASFIQMQQR